MRDIIACPHCRRRLQLPDDYANQMVECPSCRNRFVADPMQEVSATAVTGFPDETTPAAVDAELLETTDRVQDGSVPKRRARTIPLDLWGATADRGRPDSGRTAYKWLGLAVVVGIVAVVGLFLLIAQVNSPGLPKRVAEDDEQRRQELVEAFRQQQPLAADEIGAELKPLFEGLGDAFTRGDRAAIMAHFDIDRALDELGDTIPQPRRHERPRVVRGLADGMGQALQRQAQLLAWEGFEVKHIKKLEGNEAVVIVRHRVAQGGTMKMRWWVSKRPGTWKIYDFEDLDVGLRFSTNVTALAHMGLGKVQEASRAVQDVSEALLAVAVQNDPDAADRKLQQSAGVKLPPKVEALRLLATGLVRLQRHQFKESLDALDQAHGCNADMPCLDMLKGFVHNRLGNWDKALKHLEAYQALLGDDAVVCCELGEALRGMGRFPEACAVYRKSLDYNPKEADAFLGLLRTLAPGDNKDDLGTRFAKLDSRHENFDIFAEDCKVVQDVEALEQLASAMRKIDPNYATVDYYLALARIWAGREQEAAPLLHSAVKKAPLRRPDFTAGFLQAMVNAGKSREAYAALADPRDSFRLLAFELKKAFRTEDVRELVSLHAKKHGDDPLLVFYQADIHVNDGNYELGEKMFAAAMAVHPLARPPDPTTLDQFRWSRVLAHYHTGKAVAAYKEIGPKRLTFQQLANLCLEEQNYKALEPLLDAHAREEPNDPELARCRCRMKIKQGQFADGIAVFKTALGKFGQEQEQQLVSDFLYDMADAGQVLAAYQAAPDARYAFQVLAGDLRGAGLREDLRRLLDAHRLRQPDDSWLVVFTAQLHLDDKSWDKAAAALGEAWKDASAEVRERFRPDYVLAMYRAGRTMEAYEHIEPRKQTFPQLANLLIMHKKGAELQKLIEVHRLHAGDDADLLWIEARAKILAKQPNEAVPLWQKAHQKQPADFLRRDYVGIFLRDMQEAGHGLDAYRAVPDKAVAFEMLASGFVFRKKDQELERLLEEHGKNHAHDVNHRFYSGELHLLRGDAGRAEKDFAAALAKGARTLQWKFRDALLRAQVKGGKAVAAYQERGPTTRTFEDVAHVCLSAKNARELESLIAAHRRARPEDPAGLAWEVELKWLQQDYEGVLNFLKEHRQGLLAMSRFRWKNENYLVRCLVKLKRHQEAIKEAEAATKNRHASKVLVVLAHSADAKQAIAIIEKFQAQRFLLEDCYRDTDLGPILRSEAFHEFRQRFPEPKETLDLDLPD